MKTYDFENPYFIPWVGQDYFDIPPKLLILGESHYARKEDLGKMEEPRLLTINCVRDYAYKKWNHSFFTRISRIVSQKEASQIDRTSFWAQVAFYNYVQEIVGYNPRERPNETQWNSSKDALDEVLRKLTPNRVIILGKDLFYHLKESHFLSSVEEIPAEKNTYKEGIIKSGDFKGEFISITHPSSPHFGKVTSWYKPLKDFLQK